MLEKLPEEWAVGCPACGVPAGQGCGFVEGAPHNGWNHIARVEAFEDAVKADNPDGPGSVGAGQLTEIW